VIGRLAQMPRGDIAVRTSELLERFDQLDAADRPVRTYSGGMRCRLDLTRMIQDRLVVSACR
jgi:ABC-type multidrug transport system ATPase subunit